MRAILSLIGAMTLAMLPSPADADGSLNGDITGGGGISGDEIASLLRGERHPTETEAGRRRGSGFLGTWVGSTVGECAADGSVFRYRNAAIDGVAPGPPPGFVAVGDLLVNRLISPTGGVVVEVLANTCNGDPVPTPPPSVEEVLAAAGLPRAAVTTNPHRQGTVGLQNWFWYEGPTSVPVAVTLDGWTASAEAVAVGFTWDVGDTTIEADHPGSEDDPAARHTFIRKGTRTLVQSTTWQATLTLTGFGLTLTSPLGSAEVAGPPLSYPVVEYEAVIVD